MIIRIKDPSKEGEEFWRITEKQYKFIERLKEINALSTSVTIQKVSVLLMD